MARIDVRMPQMGESIAEGTLSRWLKKIGEAVKRDEPMFEISTDKVDAEIPAPDAGVLAEILVQEGETVPVETVVARIESRRAAAPRRPAAPAAAVPAAPLRSPLPPAAPPPPCAPVRAGRPQVAAPASRPAPGTFEERVRTQLVAARPAHRRRARPRPLAPQRERRRRAGHEARTSSRSSTTGGAPAATPAVHARAGGIRLSAPGGRAVAGRRRGADEQHPPAHGRPHDLLEAARRRT